MPCDETSATGGALAAPQHGSAALPYACPRSLPAFFSPTASGALTVSWISTS